MTPPVKARGFDRMAFQGQFLRERKTGMAISNWGLCKDCEWWQTEPEAKIHDTTMGLCIEYDLQPFHLRVAGNSGCTQYSPGEPARAAGSSAAPPTAVPQR